MTKLGRKSIREGNKDQLILLRLTEEEKQLFIRHAKNKRIGISAMIINSVYTDMLKTSYQIPLDDIQKLSLPIKKKTKELKKLSFTELKSKFLKRKCPMPKEKPKSDTELGIKTKREIESMPVSQLTDDEIAKLFFNRFNADCLVMMYQDSTGKNFVFGRRRRTKAARDFMERVANRFTYFFGTPENWKEI